MLLLAIYWTASKQWINTARKFENFLIKLELKRKFFHFRMCGPDGHYNGQQCYTYDPSLKLGWYEAEQYCQSKYGGHLASIHDVGTQYFLYKLTDSCNKCSMYGFWVGGNCHGDPDKWAWSDGTPMDHKLNVTGYKGWPPQPEDPVRQQCMTIW